MPDGDDILRFERVRADASGRYDAGLWDVDLTLHPGDLVLIRLENEHPRVPLGDAAVGLIRPASGTVSFDGVGWAARTERAAAAARGRIGRYFDDGGWVSNLSLAENVTLALRHHSNRPEHAIFDEAAEWARTFDLPGLPTGPVSRTGAQDLRRAACVRAFLGEPRLVLLERPARRAIAELMPALINATRATRARGAAVLWTTTSDAVFSSRALRPTRRCRMFGNRIRTVSETPPCPTPSNPAASTAPSVPSSSSASSA